MHKKLLTIFLGLTIILFGCRSDHKDHNENEGLKVHSIAAMKDVMWKGELFGKINLDTIKNKTGLYGLGPESYLTGEILINDGKIFVSRVEKDSSIVIEQNNNIVAPFFVYGNVQTWHKTALPKTIKSIKDLEQFLDNETKSQTRPFAFKLDGRISDGIIHIQNLPKGTKVSSPKEAHQGQVNYELKNEDVEIIGFFSTEHQGIFTHHDSYLHMHLITKDIKKMGHLDEINFEDMTLYLPKS
jgi:acetolactate decarboxylase